MLELLGTALALAGGWSTPMPISPVGRYAQQSQVVAGNANGSAIVAWERDQRVSVVRVNGGGPLSEPLAMVGGEAENPLVAINERGDYAVAFVSKGRTLAGLHNDNAFDTTFTECSLSPAGLGLAESGVATVVWQDCDTLYSADFAPRAGDLTPRIAIPSPVRPQNAQLKVAADGSAVAVWTGYTGLYAATRPAGGAWTTVTLTADQPQGAALSLTPDGTAVVTNGTLVYVKPPGGTFGAPITLPMAADYPVGADTVIAHDTRKTYALSLAGGVPVEVFPFPACGTDAVQTSTLFVVGRTACGGGPVWGAVRTDKGFVRTRLTPDAKLANYPPRIAPFGPGALVVWPVSSGPPRNRGVMAATTWRATPLIAFVGKPRVSGRRIRVRVRTSHEVRATLALVRGRRIVTRTRRTLAPGTHTLTLRGRGTRLVLSVPRGDEITRAVGGSATRSGLRPSRG
ncbi:hypothetical protein OJ998_01390 [Solirubrobacter taibaiensis]|nr:hypothetical protein [Solirubrobacter taibaiensis]